MMRESIVCSITRDQQVKVDQRMNAGEVIRAENTVVCIFKCGERKTEWVCRPEQVDTDMIAVQNRHCSLERECDWSCQWVHQVFCPASSCGDKLCMSLARVSRVVICVHKRY